MAKSTEAGSRSEKSSDGYTLSPGPEEQPTAQVEFASLSNVKAIKSRAIEGDAEAQRMLGLIFELGLSSEGDQDEAPEWYMRAALRGLPAAQFQLAKLYIEGRGVPRDVVSSYVWMALAARAGHASARTLLPLLADSMTAKELLEANGRVLALRLQS